MRLSALASCLLVLSACKMMPDPADGDSKAGDGLVADKNDDDTNDPTILEARVCAAGTTTLGIDVSYYQGTINWTSVKNSGISYAFIRVSDGTGFHDPKFAANWAGTKAAGVIRGPYQFFRANQDVNAQADLMINSIINDYQLGDLPPVLDVEATNGMSAATIASRAKQWVARVKAAVGVEPIIYTGFYFWRDSVGNPSGFSSNPLWIAAYTSSCPTIPSTWSRWTFWQYTDSGKVSGISGNVDMNRFNGSLDDLIVFAGGAVSMPPPASCASATMNTDLPEGSCVQAASDGEWYQCEGGSWFGISSTSACSDTYAWCDSATLGVSVPPRTCVQAASDREWYQCDGKSWVQPTTSASGPAGTCASSHPL